MHPREPAIISPNQLPRAALDAATAAYYDLWKQTYLEPACKPGEYRIRSLGATKAYAVSEGHGYAMIALPLMAGHDPEARRLFDGFYRYYRGHPTVNHDKLMAWAQNKECADVGGRNSATDAGVDIAYGLLLADRQWGSDGDIDYRAAAADLIKTILEAEVTPAHNLSACRQPSSCVTATIPPFGEAGHFATVVFSSTDVTGLLEAAAGGVRLLTIDWTAHDLSATHNSDAYDITITDAAANVTGALSQNATYVESMPNGEGCGVQWSAHIGN